LIVSDPSAANDTLVLVSDMLRHAVDTARVQEVALREELATLRLYTAIQQVRFGDRLRLTWEIDEDTIEAAVPHMLLQPLVENAIKHGVEALWLSIRDDGPGYAAPSSRKGSGMGIANVRSRLAQVYGDSHVFSVGDAEGGGTQVVIRIPFVVMTAGDDDEQPASEGARREGGTANRRVEHVLQRTVVNDGTALMAARPTRVKSAPEQEPRRRDDAM